MNKPRFFSRKGFTLIELLVVISIISMLSSVVLASLNGTRDRARVSAGLKFATFNNRAFATDAEVYYDFNEGQGVTVNDSWGKHQGTLINAPTWVTDTALDQKTALRFNQDQNGNIQNASQRISLNGTLKITNQVTVSSWVKTSHSLSRAIISNREGGGALFFGVSGAGGKVYAYYNPSTIPGFTSIASINDGKWHHIAWTSGPPCDAQAEPVCTSIIYIDGKEDSRISRTIVTRSGTGSIAWDIANGYFSGIIDDVAIYNRGLLSSEIQQIYAEGVKRLKLAEN